MALVYIALGSNLKHPKQQVESAIAQIAALTKTIVLTVSPFYRSLPFGVQDQPDFLNAVIKVETTLAPIALLDTLQYIELNHGRERNKERFGPRTLDLDILLYGCCDIQNERLTVPHYDMKNREFMLYPLFDIEPELIFPDGISLLDIIKRIPKNGLVYWSDEC